MSVKHLVTVGTLAGIGLIIGAAGAVASPTLLVRDPQETSRILPPPPLLAPPEGAGGYTPVDARRPVAPPDSRPVAQLSAAPSDLANVDVFFSPEPLPGAPTEEVSFRVLSSVRYRGVDGFVLVTAARPSAGAAAEPLNLGTRVTLRDGTTAWAYTTTRGRGDFRNVVIRPYNDLLITVAGNLPMDRLQQLAATVVVSGR